MNAFLRTVLCLAVFAVVIVRPGQTDVTAHDSPQRVKPGEATRIDGQTRDGQAEQSDASTPDEPSSTNTAEETGITDHFATNIDAAIAASTFERLALIVFTADWSTPCNTFEQQVLTDEEVRQAIADCVVPARVDLTDRDNDAAYAIARRFDIRAVPTILLVNPHGQVVDVATGTFPAHQFARWINPELPPHEGE